jgi:RNA polymerase sigma factor (sigma-70 family)
VQNSEELIVSEIRKGNERVLHDLYRAYYPMIRNLVISNSGTEQEAKDIYQEAVIAFYERIQEINFRLTCKIKTYLYAICRRLWLKRLAQKKLNVMKIDEVEEFLQVDEEWSAIEENEKKFSIMKVSLNTLGEPCKTIIQDFYFYDLTMEQISDKFGYTNADNAKNQKYKCLQRLKKSFFDSYK